MVARFYNPSARFDGDQAQINDEVTTTFFFPSRSVSAQRREEVGRDGDVLCALVGGVTSPTE
jgi:hypothetical protein